MKNHSPNLHLNLKMKIIIYLLLHLKIYQKMIKYHHFQTINKLLKIKVNCQLLKVKINCHHHKRINSLLKIKINCHHLKRINRLLKIKINSHHLNRIHRLLKIKVKFYLLLKTINCLLQHNNSQKVVLKFKCLKLL